MTPITRRYHFHAPGLLYIALVLVVGLGAMNNQNNLLFWVFGVMVSGLAISGVVSAAMLARLHVRRVDPLHGTVGEPLIVRYAVSNRGRFMSVFNIHVEERAAGPRSWRRLMPTAQAWIMHIAPRETVHGEAVFWPAARGEARFNHIRVWTTFPFGLVKKSITISHPQHTLIYPRIHELRRNVLASITPAGLVGSRISQHAGAGDDYYGMREFRLGDSLRHIAWKRVAQADELVVIERTAPSPARLRVVLDLTRPSDESNRQSDGSIDQDCLLELEERAISLCGSLLRAADRHGFEIGLTVLGFGMPPIALRRNQWHLGKMMAALAGLDLEACRAPSGSEHLLDAERAGLMVIVPREVQPLRARPDALYLTAAQLDSLSVGAIGWKPQEPVASTAAGPNLRPNLRFGPRWSFGRKSSSRRLPVDSEAAA